MHWIYPDLISFSMEWAVNMRNNTQSPHERWRWPQDSADIQTVLPIQVLPCMQCHWILGHIVQQKYYFCFGQLAHHWWPLPVILQLGWYEELFVIKGKACDCQIADNNILTFENLQIGVHICKYLQLQYIVHACKSGLSIQQCLWIQVNSKGGTFKSVLTSFNITIC